VVENDISPEMKLPQTNVSANRKIMSLRKNIPSIDQLDTYLSGALPAQSADVPEYTVGIEHEFFIEKDGLPASSTIAHELFETLIGRGWQVRRLSHYDGTAVPICIVPPGHTKTVLKYEHYPNLIEIAFDWRENLYQLNDLVLDVMKQVTAGCREVGLDLRMSPFCCVGADHPATWRTSHLAESLRSYRHDLLLQQGRHPTPKLLNFSAVIASTQVHVGGLAWWTKPQIIAALYSYETTILGLSYLLTNSQGTPEDSVVRRWKGYRDVLEGIPLVGFPQLEQWNKTGWLDALRRSPNILFDGQNPADFLEAVRDLQIIRPRTYGTLEFRADPAQGSVAAIMAMAALRLACAIGATKGAQLAGNFAQHREDWWSHAIGQRPSLPYEAGIRLLDQAAEWLGLRRKGEQDLLAPLRVAVEEMI
jgi:hypothetical protein